MTALPVSAPQGAAAVPASVLREQAWIIRLLRAYGTCETASASEALLVTVRLPSSATMARGDFVPDGRAARDGAAADR